MYAEMYYKLYTYCVLVGKGRCGYKANWAPKLHGKFCSNISLICIITKCSSVAHELSEIHCI